MQNNLSTTYVRSIPLPPLTTLLKHIPGIPEFFSAGKAEQTSSARLRPPVAILNQRRQQQQPIRDITPTYTPNGTEVFVGAKFVVATCRPRFKQASDTNTASRVFALLCIMSPNRAIIDPILRASTPFAVRADTSLSTTARPP